MQSCRMPIESGVFRQPRLHSPTHIPQLSDFVLPPSPSVVIKNRKFNERKSSVVSARKPSLTNAIYEPTPSVIAIFKRVKMYADTMRKVQSQQVNRRRSRSRKADDFINLSDITVNGEIPTKGILVGKIMNLETDTRSEQAQMLKTKQKNVLKNNGVSRDNPPHEITGINHSSAPKRNLRRISRGVQPITLVLLEDGTQHDVSMQDSQVQYNWAFEIKDVSNIAIQTEYKEAKLSKDEILSLLRATYTTADVAVGVYTRSPHTHRNRPMHSYPSGSSTRSVEGSPPLREDSPRYKLSKEQMLRDLCNQKNWTMRLFGSKMSSKEAVEDTINDFYQRSESEATLTLSSDAQNDDPFPLGHKAKILLSRPVSKSTSQISRIPRIVSSSLYQKPSTTKNMC